QAPPMRILVTIPHYFAHTAAAGHSSERGAAASRVQVIRQCLASLYQTFSEAQGLLDGRGRYIHPANLEFSANITIALCTTGDSHLVSHLGDYDFTHIHTTAEPRLLG